jgi:hypothetical protein
MYEIIAITPVTMKRMMNYQRVVERESEAANARQWRKMTADNMRSFEAARKRAERLGGVVAYAGFLYRVQNNLTSYRVLPSEHHLHNGLVDLMNELGISVAFVAVDISEDDAPCIGNNGRR